MGIIYKAFDLIGRIFITVMFLQVVIGKVENYSATSGYMASKGVPSVLLPVVIALEIVGSVAIILGWKTRIFAFALAGICILAALLFHWNFADQTQSIMFMKNIAIAGGFLVIFSHGAGAISLDKTQQDRFHRKKLRELSHLDITEAVK
jgi:putative oxidoreductase